MSCKCKEIEKLYGSCEHKWEEYRRRFPDCGCEGHSVSDHSPGVVSGRELLFRLLYVPIHIDPNTGELTPNAFDDVFIRGLSVNRKDYTTHDQLERKACHAILESETRQNPKTDWEVAAIKCAIVKSITNEFGNRLYCVHDTALPNDKSHADIFVSISPNPSPRRPNKSDKKMCRLIKENFVRCDFKKIFGD